MSRHILPLLAAVALILACCAYFAPAYAESSGAAQSLHSVHAQTATVTPGGGDGGAWSLIGNLLKAFQSHDWELVAGLILMLVVMAARGLTRLAVVPDTYVPWLTTAFAVVTALGMGLASHQSLWQILTTGISVGFGAIGAYETVGKAAKLYAHRTPPAAPPAAPPAVPPTTPPAGPKAA